MKLELIHTALATDTSFLDPLPDVGGADGSNLTNLLTLAYTVAGILVVGMIAFSGIKYMLSNGNPGKVAEATQSLIWSIAGLAVILLASVIISFVVTNITALAGNAMKQVFFFAGIIAVIMIVFAGLRYITSSGDSGRSRAATQTLIYAIVGLVVCILASVIVSFVMSLL